jgi:hypothetical protein
MGRVAMDIDRKRIAAVHALEALGFTYRNGTWLPAVAAPSQALPLIAEVDAMHGALMQRADALAGCMEGSNEEAELEAIIDAIEAYEAKRWPLGKDPNVPGGKG